MVALLRDLKGPVEVALARSQEAIPAAPSLKGGALYELKWDGYRINELEPGTVLDGEAVIWNGASLDFDLLQRGQGPCFLMVFDVLAHANPAL